MFLNGRYFDNNYIKNSEMFPKLIYTTLKNVIL